jgi:hypothetical protein
MTTEYLALWLHFLWSGLFTIVFSAVAWWKFGLVTARAGRSSSGPAISEGAREATKKRRRLLSIAVMVSACLLVMTGALLSTSFKLEEWSRTADTALSCAIKETPFARDWGAYGFNEGDIVEVCNSEMANEIQLVSPCVGSCFWYPTITANALTCGVEGWPLEEEREFSNRCNCPCSAFIEIERPRFYRFVLILLVYLFFAIEPPPPPSFLPSPSSFPRKPPLESVATLTLAQVAQSLVVAIVGLNLGFRFKRPVHSLLSCGCQKLSDRSFVRLLTSERTT